MKLDQKQREWVAARKRHHLSHAHVQMARELGMNPTKLGSLDNHRQEPWKLPLPEFIAHLYEKRFRRARPEVVLSIEDRRQRGRPARRPRKPHVAQRLPRRRRQRTRWRMVRKRLGHPPPSLRHGV